MRFLLIMPLLTLGSVVGCVSRLAEVNERPPGDVRPFTIEIPRSTLADLQNRLHRVRWPDQLSGAEWDYGTELSYLQELVAYWRDDYDWRSQERGLNELPQFKTEIDGRDVHFIHVRSPEPNALPLVLNHGWPGSPFEFHKVIGPLTDPVAHGGKAEDAFHVVCPSMPGYAFSDRPTERGFSFWQVAETVAELMARLGYSRYGAQGGDWGFAVSSALGEHDAKHVVGIHLNLVWVLPPEGVDDPSEGVPAAEWKRHRERAEWWEGENAYGKIHGTKPQTLSYGLNDSPVGLAAWIVEKWRTWSDCGGDVESRFSKDEILNNVMIYWLTQTIGSSTRLYYETFRLPPMQWDVRVPTAVAVFPGETAFTPRRWVERSYNLTQWTEMPRGGHFAAMEEPKLLVEDIRRHFRSLR